MPIVPRPRPGPSPHGANPGTGRHKHGPKLRAIRVGDCPRRSGERLEAHALTAELDDRVRIALYERFVDAGRPPGTDEVAAALGIPLTEAEAAYRRLAENHVVVLMPGTTEIWMAAPLSAVPTGFRVETPRGGLWGNCIWDGLGAVAMLGGDGSVETRCADCEEPMTLRVEGYELLDGDGVAHFAVPAARWWENIGFT